MVFGKNSLYSGTTTKASAANASWNSVLIDTDFTLTGTTNVTNSSPINMVSLNAPTLHDASAVNVDTASTLYIEGPPNSSGLLTFSNAYALFVDAGPTRLNGTLQVNGGGGISATDAGGLKAGTQGLVELMVN